MDSAYSTSRPCAMCLVENALIYITFSPQRPSITPLGSACAMEGPAPWGLQPTSGDDPQWSNAPDPANATVVRAAGLALLIF